jgi:hypothetical protein
MLQLDELAVAPAKESVGVRICTANQWRGAAGSDGVKLGEDCFSQGWSAVAPHTYISVRDDTALPVTWQLLLYCLTPSLVLGFASPGWCSPPGTAAPGTP